jgi:hypothetical protein
VRLRSRLWAPVWNYDIDAAKSHAEFEKRRLLNPSCE